MKHVVSVGLGSSTRDAYIETEILGQEIIIERRGSDGDMNKAAQLIADLDGKVDAFGLGGTDLFIMVGDKKYYLRDSKKLAKNAIKTPIVCGAGLKDSLERIVVKKLNSSIDWKNKKVLMLSAVDRFGMAESIDSFGAEMIYADLIYILGLPIPLKTLKSLRRTAYIIAPIAAQLPIKWLYPTGSSQEKEKAETGWKTKHFAWADVIAGDFHFIKRYAPADLAGKTVLTNTTTPDDVEMLKKRGLKTLITTTPRFNGRSLSTNMLEAALVAVSEKFPLTKQDYDELIAKTGLEGDRLELN